MKKKLFALILIFLLVFSIPANAYQISGFELHCEAAVLISLDTGDVLYSKNADK
jgi:D-alanyl-D-alanine carboxypeptidase